jgi:hypothetical protein
MPLSRIAFKSYPLAGSRRRPSKICLRLTPTLYNVLYKCQLLFIGPLQPSAFQAFAEMGRAFLESLSGSLWITGAVRWS